MSFCRQLTLECLIEYYHPRIEPINCQPVKGVLIWMNTGIATLSSKPNWDKQMLI